MIKSQLRFRIAKMEFEVIEQTYPESFRQDLTDELISKINKRQSVVFAGMRRVGISNFLRFFLYHKKLTSKILGDKKHLFIAVDLNDLTERTLPSFWILTLKRVLDSAENTGFNPKTIKSIEKLFLDGIQSKDSFMLIENIKMALNKIIAEDVYPTIFFIRFDRITEAASAEFFANLEGFKSSTHNKVSFVFTTSRGLNSVSPKVFSHTSLSLAEFEIFLKPAKPEDLKIISGAYIKRFGLRISTEAENELLKLTGGYVQYLQLALIILNELEGKTIEPEEIEDLLLNDERIRLQTEELLDGLTSLEQELLHKVSSKQKLTEKEINEAKYLIDSGFISPANEGFKIFSPVFETLLNNKNIKGEGNNGKLELSKKEHLLFSYLKNRIDQVCEREDIIEAVWPEEEALGVTDWAIDRLVARLRKKMKEEGKFEIVTVKTRGFKLIKTN